MKNFVLYSVALIGMFAIGMAYGQANPISKIKRAKVDVVKFGDMIDITILPHKGYKWNEEFPATLKFSVCNDVECLFVTEKIKIKKD